MMNTSNNNPSGFDKAATLNKEKCIFLKELAANPETDISELAKKLSMNEARAWKHLNSFLRQLSETTLESDFIKLKNVINEGVEFEYMLNDEEIRSLIPLLEKYGDSEMVEKFNINQTKANNPQVVTEAPTQAASITTPPVQAPQSQPQVTQTVPVPEQATSVASHEATLQAPRNRSVPPGAGGYSAAQLNSDQYQDPSQSQQGTQQGQGTPVDFGQYTTDDLNMNYDFGFISELKRTGLMRWVLMTIPTPPMPAKRENWMRNFTVNQDELMAMPEILHTGLKGWFGDKPGDDAFRLFNTYLRFLPPAEHYGQKKNDVRNMMGGAAQMGSGFPGQMYGGGQQFADPFNTYWHAEGILPFGMHIDSGDARRLIAEEQAKRRQKKDRREEREEMLEDMRMAIQGNLTTVFDKNRLGGGGANPNDPFGGNNMLPFLLMSGNIALKPTFDQEGKMSYAIEPRQGNGHAGNEITAKDLLEYNSRTWDVVNKTKDEGHNLQITMLREMMQMNANRNPVNDIIELSKYQKEMMSNLPGGYGNNQAMMSNNIDIARIWVENEKFKSDKEFTKQLLEQKFKEKSSIADYDFKRERESSKMRKAMLQTIGQVVSAGLPLIFNALMIFSGRGASLQGAAGMGGGLGNLMNMVGPLGKLLTQGTGGGRDEDEDEDEDEDDRPRHRRREYENDDSGGGGFDLSGMMQGAMEMIKNMASGGGMPGAGGMPGGMGGMGGGMPGANFNPPGDFSGPPSQSPSSPEGNAFDAAAMGQQRRMRREREQGINPNRRPATTMIYPENASTGGLYDALSHDTSGNIGEVGPAEMSQVKSAFSRGPAFGTGGEVVQAQEQTVTRTPDGVMETTRRVFEGTNVGGVAVGGPGKSMFQTATEAQPESTVREMMHPNVNVPTEQPPQQVQPQPEMVIQEAQPTEDYRMYTPDDFKEKNLSKQEIQAKLSEGMKSLDSIKSFVSSASQALHDKEKEG